MNPPVAAAPSFGLNFLRAARMGMPRTLGDRERIAAMNRVLGVAIDCRMAFGRNEGAALARLNEQTCVGVFRALDESWYSRACLAGGTYAALWESHHGLKPWLAPVVIIGTHMHEQAENSHVAPHMALLLPKEKDGDVDPDMPAFGAHHVWWCTRLDVAADTITLCRYRLTETHRYPLHREGQPRKRRVLDRVGWKALFAPAEAVPA